MDNFKAVGSGIGGVISCLCGCACLAGAITFVVYLGKYAFDNPNLPAWYGEVTAADGTVTQMLYPTLESAEAALGADAEIDDIHGKFVMWFLWGFIMSFGPCYVMVLMLLTFWNQQLMQACSALGGCALCSSGLAWWICAMVWRLNAAGSFASGDVVADGMTEEAWITAIELNETTVQYSSGNFMYIYLLITWITLGVGCGCSILGWLIACMCK